MGAWAPARRARGGVLVIHENRGLNDSIRAVAGRLAASGYSSLAIDLLSEEGGTGSFADEFEAMAALGAAPPSRFVADMKAGVTELRRRLPGKKVAATGFCFGGGMTWLLLASKESRLAAAVPFYGPFPENGSLTGARAAVLGIYAELDSRVNATRAAARAALRKAACGIRSSRTPTSTTRSSTRPDPGTTAKRPRLPIAGCWPGSAARRDLAGGELDYALTYRHPERTIMTQAPDPKR